MQTSYGINGTTSIVPMFSVRNTGSNSEEGRRINDVI